MDQRIEERNIHWSKILEPEKPKQSRKNLHRMGQSLRLRPERRLQRRSLPDGQANMVGWLELLLEQRKKRRVYRSRLPRSGFTPDSIGRVTRREKGKVRATRGKKGSKASIRIRKGRADPLKPRQEDRRRGRNRRAKEILEKSMRRRRSRRSTRSLCIRLNSERTDSASQGKASGAASSGSSSVATKEEEAAARKGDGACGRRERRTQKNTRSRRSGR